MIFSVSISRRRVLLSALAGFGAACIMSSTGSAAPDSPAPATAAAKAAAAKSDPVHDFDAFFGTWHVRHRRLKERLAGNNEWIEFEGSQTMQPVLGGEDNMTDNVFNMPDGSVQRGITLRAFDPKTRKWSIWWLDGNKPIMIDVPVVGGFDNGSGALLCGRHVQGKTDQDPLPLAERHAHHAPVGTGFLARCRQDMGNQLDRALHQEALSRFPPPSRTIPANESPMTDDLDRRRMMQLSLAAFSSLITLDEAGSAAAKDLANPAAGSVGPEHDFDFFLGSWHVKRCRLKKRLADNNEWEEFDGATSGSILRPPRLSKRKEQLSMLAGPQN